MDSADAVDLAVSGPPGVTWSGLGGHKSEGRDRSVLLLRGSAALRRGLSLFEQRYYLAGLLIALILGLLLFIQ